MANSKRHRGGAAGRCYRSGGGPDRRL